MYLRGIISSNWRLISHRDESSSKSKPRMTLPYKPEVNVRESNMDQKHCRVGNFLDGNA